MKKNTFMGSLMAMIMVIIMLVTFGAMFKTARANYIIEKTNAKYEYMNTNEYQVYRDIMNERYNR